MLLFLVLSREDSQMFWCRNLMCSILRLYLRPVCCVGYMSHVVLGTESHLNSDAFWAMTVVCLWHPAEVYANQVLLLALAVGAPSMEVKLDTLDCD